jgi:hypothetical protein
MGWRAVVFAGLLGTAMASGAACGLAFSTPEESGAGGGTSTPCDSVTDCPLPSSACAEVTCQLGRCQLRSLPDGALPAALQASGDCKQAACEAGSLVFEAAGQDLPNDQLDCTADECAGDTPVHPNLPAGTPCGQEGSGLSCNDRGTCTGCTSPEQCGADMPCVQYTCSGEECGVQQAPEKTPMPDPYQAPGDCKQVVCGPDGKGETLEPLLTDVPPPSQACRIPGCTSSGEPATEEVAPDNHPCDDGVCCEGTCRPGVNQCESGGPAGSSANASSSNVSSSSMAASTGSTGSGQ